jgi:predicted AAA+ superfamily ATPase
MIARLLEKQVLQSLRPHKVVCLFGARRTGKTVLMTKVKNEVRSGKVLMVHGENLDVAEILSSQRTSKIKNLVTGYTHLFIDEAQKIPHIGSNLKLMVDTIPNLSIFVSGSSSFDLKEKIGEPLVGRSHYFHLYPIAQIELKEMQDYLTAQENLETELIFGSYPEVFTSKSIEEKKQALEEIKNGYLLKDILELDNIKDSLFVFNLLRLIAFQIGNDISYSELASSLNSNKKTVMRYLELLEKTYILFSLPGFSRNMRTEYTKTPRYYFWDNGIRNSIISNYNFLNSRDDVGKLWENFCIVERIKATNYKKLYTNRFFWRTYDQKEIDYVEEKDGNLFGYEFKWSKTKAKIPKIFLETYKDSTCEIISRENYLRFIT